MCAINGFNKEDTVLLERMNAVTRHRGPDGTGVFVGDGISLGHNRLSIIDLSDAAGQPMWSADKKNAIVFNGEIYNFRDLRNELRDSYEFRTESDTEVILASYKKWGNACVERFNGIFSFALWNTETRELFLARDHMGVKPLYYFLDDTQFIFSSEIKAILEHDIPRKLDHEAFSHYLRLEYVPEPLTMFSGIKKFPKAHYGTFKNGELHLVNYWSVSQEAEQRSKKTEEDGVRERLYTAVERQLVSDRPVGVYLSGGIDSSAVVHAMTRAHSNIQTFSVGFSLEKSEEEEKFNADFHLARRTAEHYHTNHHEVLLSSDDVVRLFEKAVWHLDEPISNPTEIAMLKLAEFAKRDVAVVLGGDGGDEIFGGYDRYRLSRIASLYQRVFPSVARTFLSKYDKFKKLNTPPDVRRFELFLSQNEEPIREVVQDAFFDAQVTERFFREKFFPNNRYSDFEAHFMHVDRQTWLADDSLVRSDKMSMAYGLEARVPFLDRELVEFAATIPIQHKVTPFRTKIVLKNALRGEIPDFLFSQPKRGWFSPGAKWLRHPNMQKLAREVLSPTYHEGTKDLFKWEALSKMLDDHIAKRRYNLTVLWGIMTFQLWAKRYDISL